MADRRLRPPLRHLALWACLLLAAAVAPAELPKEPSAAAEPLEIAPLLRPFVKTLSRPIHTWHYATRQRMGLPDGPVAPDDPALQTYLQQKFTRYWDLSLEPAEGSMVSGLYMAFDPVASRAYGGVGDGWGLVQIPLGKGFSFVDVRLWGDERDKAKKLPADLQEKLRQRGCKAQTAASLLTMMESRACREIAVRTMTELDVDGILYTFPVANFANCADRPKGALILFRPEAVDLPHVRVFTNESPADAMAGERRRIRDLFERAQQAGSVRTPPWPDLAATPVPAAMEPWMKEHLFGCGTYLEDRMLDLVNGDDLAYWTEQSRLAPGSADVRYYLAAALDRRGQREQAVAQYLEALRLDPSHVPAINDLARIRAASPDAKLRDAAEAVRLAEQLVSLTQYRQRTEWPKAYKTLCSMTLAMAYHAAGVSDRAEGYARHAFETATQQHAASATPLSAKRLEEARQLLAAYGAKSAQAEPKPAAASAQHP
jgi:tetratricopeptide (TPR) repeat protein